MLDAGTTMKQHGFENLLNKKKSVTKRIKYYFTTFILMPNIHTI